MRCPACDIEIPGGVKFCPECGARQTAPLLSGDENRQLTVMFADMVGSTALSEQLDPERLRDIMAAYHEHVSSIVQARGGTVAQYLGDGVLVYFGYPNAHEDDPDRAVFAGLDLLEGLADWNDRIESDFGVRLQLRLGVHTGDVVVAQVADSRDRLAVGMSVNVASRLCDAAGVDSLAISDFTRKLIGVELDLEPMGRLALKGVSEPVEVLRVLGRGPQGPVRAATERAFFGRDSELAAVTACFESVRAGSARCVVVEGEAGIGKSRLLAAFRQRVRATPSRWLEARCSHFHRGTALRPIAQLTAQALGLAGLPDPDAQRARLTKYVVDGEEAANYRAGLLLRLLGLEVPAPFALPAFSPERIRGDTMNAVIHVIRRVAAEGPVVLVIEDLHWIDPSSLEVLEQLVGLAELPLLVLVARRHDAPEPWSIPERAMLLKLDGLADASLDQLICFHLGEVDLAADVQMLIRDTADGIPLFAEELTKMVVESGIAAYGGGPVGVPATLQDSLMARLDRLHCGKPVAQIAAAIGRSFDGGLIARVAGLTPEFAAEGFRELLGADLIEHAEEGTERYAFRHALIQQAAYGSLLRRDRVRVHARIAEAMVEGGRVDAAPARAAHHYAESGQSDRAIELWTRAGQTALASSAAQEAILHFENALPLIERLDEAERDGRELPLRIGLAHANEATTGYGASAVRENFGRAAELCDRSPSGQPLFRVASGLWGYEVVHGDPEASTSALTRLREMARASGKPRHLFQAEYAEGVQSFYAGRFEQACESFARADGMVEARAHSGPDLATTDSVGNCPMYLGWVEHFVGLCDQGYARQEAGVEASEKAGQAFPLTEALTHLVNLRHDRLEAAGTARMCDRVLELSIEYGFDFWLGICHSVRGWALSVEGEWDDGIREARQGLEIFERTGSYVPHVYRASCLVEALMAAERWAEALTEIQRALAHSAGRYDRFWDSEILRLQGLCRLHTGQPFEEVEREWLAAIDLAERQSAHMLSLRATTTLAESRLTHGGAAEVRDDLARRLGRVRGGDALADVRRARAVLAAL
jgi:class 3 adenylate cyclase/tetratricopeptide (TPR) repeat protein